MKNFSKICIALLLLSGKIYSQNWLWVKPQGINTTNPLIGNTRLTSSGDLVTFLAEPGGSHLQFVDGNGNVLWSQFFVNLTINDVCTDVSNNIFFAATYTNNTTIGASTFTSQGGFDALVGEFNSSGTLIKSKTFGTSSHEKANSIALSNNQIYVSGSFINSQAVDGVSLTGNNSNYNTYVLKLDMNFIAQTGIESVSPGSEGIEVGVDQSGSVYLLGNSDYTISIGTQSVYIAAQGQYLAKLTGNLGTVALTALNTHYMNGWYKPFMYFDNSSNVTLTHVTGGGGGTDNHLRLEKYDPSINQLWYKDVLVNTFDFVDQDNMDNIYTVGGYFYGMGPMYFTVIKINSTATSVVQLISDTTIRHSVLGLATKSNDDFYFIGNCNTGSNLNGYTCSLSNSVFMARYSSTATSIKKSNLNRSFNISPNPAYGILVVKTPEDVSDYTFSIRNILGQIVYTSSTKGGIKEIDVSSHPKGIYFIELRSGEEKKVERIVFQ
jgi:hypothetical protein